jgi:hypothetical protein
MPEALRNAPAAGARTTAKNEYLSKAIRLLSLGTPGFRMIERADPARYNSFVKESQAAAKRRYSVYEQMSQIKVPAIETEDEERAKPEVKET